MSMVDDDAARLNAPPAAHVTRVEPAVVGVVGRGSCGMFLWCCSCGQAAGYYLYEAQAGIGAMRHRLDNAAEPTVFGVPVPMRGR